MDVSLFCREVNHPCEICLSTFFRSFSRRRESLERRFEHQRSNSRIRTNVTPESNFANAKSNNNDSNKPKTRNIDIKLVDEPYREKVSAKPSYPQPQNSRRFSTDHSREQIRDIRREQMLGIRSPSYSNNYNSRSPAGSSGYVRKVSLPPTCYEDPELKLGNAKRCGRP